MESWGRASGLTVVNLDPAADGRWDRFVNGHEHATVYHLAAWAKILSSTYRFKPRYLALEDDAKRLRAVMPLLYKRGPVSGARLRSLPVVPVGGPLAEDEQLERELMRAACELAGDREQLVVTTSSSTLAQLQDLAVRPGLPRWVVPLDADTQARWRRSARNPGRGVRQSQAAGVRVREATSDKDLAAFYRLYLRSQRRLRGLPRRYRQLELTRELLGPAGNFRLFLVEHERRPIAGAVWLAFGKMVEGLYFGGDERYQHLRPTHALYAHVLEWALAQGYRELDLGGALPGSTLADFKSQWGAEPVPLYFYVHPAQAAPQDTNVPPAPTSVEIAEVGLLDRVFARTPLPLIRLAGAFVYRYL